jgi:hypothetical protein
MPAAMWWTLAIAAMVGMFAGSVVVVTVGIRLLEGMLARRRQGTPE